MRRNPKAHPQKDQVNHSQPTRQNTTQLMHLLIRKDGQNTLFYNKTKWQNSPQNTNQALEIQLQCSKIKIFGTKWEEYIIRPWAAVPSGRGCSGRPCMVCISYSVNFIKLCYVVIRGKRQYGSVFFKIAQQKKKKPTLSPLSHGLQNEVRTPWLDFRLGFFFFLF